MKLLTRLSWLIVIVNEGWNSSVIRTVAQSCTTSNVVQIHDPYIDVFIIEWNVPWIWSHLWIWSEKFDRSVPLYHSPIFSSSPRRVYRRHLIVAYHEIGTRLPSATRGTRRSVSRQREMCQGQRRNSGEKGTRAGGGEGRRRRRKAGTVD